MDVLLASPLTSLDTASTAIPLAKAILGLSAFLTACIYLPKTRPLWKFIYQCFFKLHGKSNNQQTALEKFYAGQADIYDATRSKLLRGREEMLAMAANKLILDHHDQMVWIDIGGGTGWNIEQMNEYLDVESFFHAVYLVDLSPSLCAVARNRFKRLGWENVRVVCADARTFTIEDYEEFEKGGKLMKADWISMSYSLSMIPDHYSAVDHVQSLLSLTGFISVVDFYVQSAQSYTNKTYTGGGLSRHVNWFSRLFWKLWFEFDRVSLDEGRRDYLEYRFGTIHSINARNKVLASIPYYIFLGGHINTSTNPHDAVSRIDSFATESPQLTPLASPAIRSKGFEAAVSNIKANLPLPSAFYQRHHWRIYYDEHEARYTQFPDTYIYAFTWEDPKVDKQLLKIGRDDVVLAITSAGDNVLSYALQHPRRIHAVDLNPAQNHLLELKLASFTALSYDDTWKLFGEGRHEDFKTLLTTKLSGHLSSRAMQYWMKHTNTFSGNGLYETGGTRIAVKMSKWIFKIFGLSGAVKQLCAARTLNEQREIWRAKVRPLILSKWLSSGIVANEHFLWRALGVPQNQRDLITEDGKWANVGSGRAMWEYVVNTLDPVAENSLLGSDNYFYLLCLQGRYTKECHPAYLHPQSHAKLSRPNAFDGVRIHTDEIQEVLARLQPGSLTIAVIMDSMDWFDRSSFPAREQIHKLSVAMKAGGRVMFRSAALKPWYTQVFESEGFTCKREGTRLPGRMIDRVNMYASTWIAIKVREKITIDTDVDPLENDVFEETSPY